MSETLHGYPEQLPQPQEIERKWTIPEIPTNLHEFAHKRIRQGYVAIDEQGTEVRLRDKEGAYTLTVKSKGDLVRGEFETPISADQFNILWGTTEGKRVEKTRYSIPSGNNIIELDVYEGDLAGLVTAEVEFTSVKDAYQFEVPHWFGDDVTENSAYKNQNLAQAGLPV